MKLRLWNVKYSIDEVDQAEVLIIEAGTAGTAHTLALAFVRRRQRAEGSKGQALITSIEESGTIDVRSR